MRTFDEYRSDDAKSQDELTEIEYYITDYFSYAEVPGEEYNNRLREIVRQSDRMSDEAKRYVLWVCLKEAL
jgi:hypothetical protein